MSDDRYQLEPGDDDDHPYLEVPKPGTRPAQKQPWYRDAPGQHISADEIAAFIQREWPAPEKRKRVPNAHDQDPKT